MVSLECSDSYNQHLYSSWCLEIYSRQEIHSNCLKYLFGVYVCVCVCLCERERENE